MLEWRMSTPRLTYCSNFQETREWEETKVPTKGARSRDGLLYPTYFWNQRRDGRRMQNVHEAFSGEIGREGRWRLPFVISWLRTRTSFEILKSVNTSIRGSRQPFFRNEVADDFIVHCKAADHLYEIIVIFVNPFCTEIFIFLYFNWLNMKYI